MFMDFIGVCLDPIMNQAAKLHYMSAGALEVLVVFRTQTGAGRAAGAQHSQSLEAMVAHVPGLKVVMPGTVTDARNLLLAAVEDPNPVVYVENRRLYAMKGSLDDEHLPLGCARTTVAGEEVTIVTWGQMLRASEAAAEASVEVIDLRSLVPLDWETLLASARAHRQGPRRPRGRPGLRPRRRDRRPPRRGAVRPPPHPGEEVAAPSVPMPFSPDLEQELLPQVPMIAAACDQLVQEG